MKLLHIIIFMLFSFFLYGQTQKKEFKKSFTFSLGLGYEDGMISVSQIPIIGISYDYQINKSWGFSSHILSYYRNLENDSYLVTSTVAPLFDKIRGIDGLFATKKETLNNSGIKPLNPFKIVKMLSVPIDIGFTYYPLSIKHHRIGINGAFSASYETFNGYRELYTGTLTFSDSSKQELFLPLSTEFRNISPGFSLKLLYEYTFKNQAIGVRWGNYNILFSNIFTYNQPVWETSLYTSFKF